jgi:hypothetical protein
MTCNQNSVFLYPVTENEVKRVINRLEGSDSAGFDNVPEVVMKCCVQFVTIPLVHIFNLFFLTGYFADILITAKIQPIF